MPPFNYLAVNNINSLARKGWFKSGAVGVTGEFNGSTKTMVQKAGIQNERLLDI